MVRSHEITWVAAFHVFIFTKQREHSAHSMAGQSWMKIASFSRPLQNYTFNYGYSPTHKNAMKPGEKKLPVQLYSISRKEQSCRLVQNGSFVDEGGRQNQYSTWIEKAVYPPTHQSMLQWFTGISLPKWCRSQLGKELEFAIISYL